MWPGYTIGVSSAWLLLLLIKLPLLLNGGALLWAIRADRAARRRFCDRHAGQVYLLWDARRGWHGFMENNVLPVLGGRVVASVTAEDEELSARYPQEVWRHLPWLPWQTSAPAPCLVVVERDGLRVVPLKATLEPLKALAEKSPLVQASVREVLEPVMRALPGRRGAAVGGLLTSAALPASR